MKSIALAAVKAIIFDEDKFLVVQITLPNGLTIWDLPGGKIENGENVLDALRREVREETNLEVNIERCIGAWHFLNIKINRQIVCTTYICRVDGSQEIILTKNPGNDNIEKYKWVTKEEFLESKMVNKESLKDLIRKEL